MLWRRELQLYAREWVNVNMRVGYFRVKIDTAIAESSVE